MPARKVSIDSRADDIVALVCHDKKDIIIEKCDLSTVIHTIPTGIYKLDGMIGGGIPIGHTTLFWGYKGSAKTSSCQRVIGNANKMCSTCFKQIPDCKCKEGPRKFVTAYFAAEPIVFTEWSKRLGVDESMIIVRPTTAEEAFDVMLSLVDSGKVDLIVLDSIAALIPEAESEGGMGDWQQGAQARIIGKFARKIQSSINRSKKEYDRATTLLFINQVRMKITMYGDPKIAPGGMAMGFANALEIFFQAKNKAEVEKDEVLGEKPVAIEIDYGVEKRRYGAPKYSGSYRMALRNIGGKCPGEILDEKPLRVDGIKLGLVAKTEGMYRFGDIVLGKNLEDVDEFLVKNKEVTDALRNAVVEIIKIM
ncbi:MAG: hypothetical protein HQK96_01460 [Nitrospirae bacterium]|nr:hypothetical protein [Nitrospirota bacterium]